MSTGNYTNNFSGVTAWPLNFNGVPVSTEGTIPAASRTTVDTTTLGTSATSSSSGINASSNLLFLATGATNNTSAVACDLNLNFSGRSPGVLTATLAQVANQTGSRVGTLQAYYSTNGTTWVQLTGTDLPFVATNNIARTATISVALPSALVDQPTVKIRFYYFNGDGSGTGSRPKISLDDLGVTSTASSPAISASPSSLSGLVATQGVAGVSKSFTASGLNLSNSITVSATDSNNFAVSTNASSGFTSSLALPANTNSIVTNTPVYVRLTGSNAGFFSNAISLSSPGATTTNVAVSGTVLRPELASTTTNITGQSAFQNSPSSAPYSFYTLTGTTITNSVNITMPSSLEVSTNAGATFSSSAVIAAPSGATFSNDVLVRISSTAPLGLFTNFITNATLGALSNVVVRVVGEVVLSNTPTIFPGEGASLSGFITIRPNPSTNQQMTVSGTNLSAGITISAPLGWQISATNTDSFTTSNITLPLTPPNTVAATPVYIRLAGTNSGAAIYNNSPLRLVSGTTTNTVFLSGKVNDPPELNVSTNALTNFSTQLPAPSASQPFITSGLNLTSTVTVTPPPGWQVSATNTNNFISAAVVLGTNASGELPATTLHVRLAGTNAAPTNYIGSPLTVVSGTNTNTVLLSGSVTLPPSFSVISAMTNFVTVQGRPTTPAQFFQFSASNLTTNVLVTAPRDYQVSDNPVDGFTNVIPFTPSGQGTLTDAAVFVRLLGNLLGPSITNIAVTSGAGLTNVSVQGNVTVAPTPTVSLGTSVTNVITATQGVPSAPVTFSVGGGNLASSVTVVAPTHYEISETIGTGYRTNIVLQPNASYELLRTLYLRIADTAPVGDDLIGIVNAHTFPFGSTNRINAAPIFFNGTVVTNTGPFIAVDPKALTGFEAVPEGVSVSQSFNLGGTNLLNLLSVAAPAGYQVSTNASNAFSNTWKFTPAVPGALAQDAGWNYYTNGVRIQGVLTNNINRGSGFAAWRIIVTNAAGGGAGMFVNDPASAGIGGMSEDSFGLFANPANASNSVIARRIFTLPLQTNETFSFQWGNNTNAGTNGNKGVTLIGSNNVPLATLNIAGSPGAITLRVTNGAVSNLLTAVGTNAINVSFTRLTTNTVRLVVPSGRDGGAGTTNFLSITSTPVGVEFYARGLPSGPTDVERNRAQPYFNNLLITTNGGTTSANVSTNVFVRLSGAGRTAGPLSGVVTLSSPGATNKFVELEGGVYGPPTLVAQPSAVTGLFAFQGAASQAKSFDLITAKLDSMTNSVSVGAGFEVSLAASNGFSTNIILPPVLADAKFPVYVRIAASAPLGLPSGAVRITAGGFAGQTTNLSVPVSGNVFRADGSPQIGQPAPSSITNLRTTLGQFSDPQPYVFSAVNLGSSNVTASVSANFEIAASTNGVWGSSVVNSPVGGNIFDVTNYVRIAAAQPGTNNNLTGVVTLSSEAPGASNQTVNLRGEVLPQPTLSLSNTNSLTNLWTVTGFQSAPQSFILSGTNLQGAVTITAATNLLVRVGNSGTYGSNAVATNSATGTLNATINVVIRSNNSVGVLTNTNGITFSTAAATALPSVRTVATVAPRPLITVNPTQLTNFYAVVSNASTPPVPFTVGGSNLLTNITLAISNTGAADKYEMSTSIASGWTNRITLVPDYSGTNSSGPPVTVAQDNAGNYSTNTAITYVGSEAGNAVQNWSNPGVAKTYGTGSNQVYGTAGYYQIRPTPNASPTDVNQPVSDGNDLGISAASNPTLYSVPSFAASVTGGPGSFVNFPSYPVFRGPGGSSVFRQGALSVSVNLGPYNSPAGNNASFVAVPIRFAVATSGSFRIGLVVDAVGSGSFAPDYVNVFHPSSGRQAFSPALTRDGVPDMVFFDITAKAGDTFEVGLWQNVATQPPERVAALSMVTFDVLSGTPSGWANGANGGSGFQPWLIQTNNGSGGAGAFIGDPANANIVGMATSSFGLYANPTNSGAFVNAQRGLSNSLAVGQTLSFQWGFNFDSGDGGNKGFNINVGTNQIANVNNAGDEKITLNSADIGFGYGTNVMTWTFTRSASNILTVSANDRDGNGTYTTNLVVPSAAVDSIKFYASQMQGGSAIDRDRAQPYFNNLLVTAPGSGGGTGGVVTNTPVYVRLKATAPVGGAQQQIDATSGTYADPRTVTLNGYVFPVMDPGLSVDPEELSMQTTQTTASAPVAFRVQGSQLGPQVFLELDNGNDFEFSVDAGATWFDVSAVINTSGGLIDRSIQVRIKDTASLGLRSGVLTLTSGTEVAEVFLLGAVYEVGNVGQLLIDPTALSGFETIEGEPSLPDVFYVAGRNLSPSTFLSATTQISQAVPPYEVSLDGVQYFQTCDLPLSPDFGGSLLPTAVYVRLTKSAAPGSQVWRVDVFDDAPGGASGSVLLDGTVTKRPVITVNPQLLLKFKTPEGKPSRAQSFTVAGSSLMTNEITLSLPAGYEMSFSENSGYTNAPLTLTGTNTTTVSQTRLFLRLAAGLPVGIRDGVLSLETLNRVQLMPLVGEVYPNVVVPTFLPPGPDGDVRALASSPTGSLYVGGSFGKMGTNNARGLARISASTGAFEQALDSGGEVFALAYAPTNSATNQAWLYAGGRFTNNGVVGLLRRFSMPAGTIDATFAPNLPGATNLPSSRVLALAVQADGKVLVGGSFSNGLARVLPSGLIETNFAAAVNGQVSSLLITNGRFLVGGSFGSVSPGGVSRQNIARFESNGMVDMTFPLAAGVLSNSIGFNGSVASLAAGPEGRIYVGGQFTGYNGVIPNPANAYQNAAVLPADGSSVNYNGIFGGGSVAVVLSRASGALLAAGSFTNATNAVTASGEVVGGLAQTSVEGIFDQSFNGGGSGAAGGSIFTALDLGGGRIVLGGSFQSFNGDTALRRLALLQMPESPAYLDWASQWFPSSSAPNAAPMAVNNPAGIPNVVVFALSEGSPFTATAAILPQVAVEGGFLTLTATKNPDAAGSVDYRVQYSEDLRQPWLSTDPPVFMVADSATLIKARASTAVSSSGGKQFLRLFIQLK